ncbi:hypothetical protein GA0115240_165316 [Streptomyces sp. DvalAA-14]|nr:hypothetical protein GA0115240_165316 [Streptomyces sp. DvalAA-14]
MPSRPRRFAAPLLLSAALALTSCGGSGSSTGALATGAPSPRLTCRVHQQVLPDHDYTGGKDGKPLAVLTMLRYFTAQKSLPFCDGKPPTAQDAAWARLYTGLTRRS